MSLPTKLFFSIANLAERWNVNQDDIIDHIVTGSLQPSVFVDDVECARYVDDGPEQMLRISGEIQFRPSMTLMTRKTFWLSGGSYFGDHVWMDIEEPEFELPCAVLLMKAQEFSIEDIRIRYGPFVKIYEEEVLGKAGAESNSEEAELKRTQRALSALVFALADEYPAYRHGDKPNLEQISKFAAKNLNKADGNPPHGWSPATFKKAIESALKNCPLPPTK